MKLEVNKIPALDAMTPERASEYMESEIQMSLIDKVNWKEQFPYHPLTAFNMAYTDECIYINFFIRCNYLRAVNYTDNSPVSEDSCVEFFCQMPNSDEYWNFEFNCIGTANVSHRVTRNNPTRLTQEELNRIVRCPSCGKRPFNELEGMFSWSLLVKIPTDMLGIDTKIGEPITMRGNFYKCASQTSAPHFLSWAPIDTPKPNFHQPQFFQEIILK